MYQKIFITHLYINIKVQVAVKICPQMIGCDQWSLSSNFPMLATCTSSGPSASRIILAQLNIRANSVSDDRPFAP